MSFLAKLYINDEERNILNASQVYSRFYDVNGRPTSKPVGWQLNFSIESTRDDSFFYENMLSPTNKCQGEIIFYKRDGLSQLFKMEFANAQILSLSEEFNAIGEIPLHMTISVGWGIMKTRDVIHEETWNPYNPFIEIEETVISEDEPEIVGYHIEDLEGNTIDKEEIEVDEEIVLVIESHNAIGETFEIDLDDSKLDYEYNGLKLEDDKLEIQIDEDIVNIPLKAILQEQD